MFNVLRPEIREKVYKAIDGERNYQNQRWNPNTTTSKGEHSYEEWLMYMEDYMNEAKHILSREARQTSDPKVAHIMRKIAAMAVCSMEQLGIAERQQA